MYRTSIASSKFIISGEETNKDSISGCVHRGQKQGVGWPLYRFAHAHGRKFKNGPILQLEQRLQLSKGIKVSSTLNIFSRVCKLSTRYPFVSRQPKGVCD